MDELVLPLKHYPEGVARPIESVLVSEYEAHGFTTTRQIIEIRDEAKDNHTAWYLRRHKYPRCPKCSHGARAWQLFNKDALRCRWGHETTRLEMIRAGR